VDLEKELRKAGYDVRTCVVGPVSSNWDRSCDFYAYLKGGTVDYGKVHSERNGHDRYGETFPGIFPEWGHVDRETGEVRKIHIVAHSMGGTTARLLAQILSEGNEEEQKATGRGTSPYFRGGRHWIKSITTISTPHDGSTLSYEITSYGQRELLTMVVVNSLLKGEKNFSLYNDLKLDYWEWTRQKKGESPQEYEERLRKIISEWNWTNKDFADFDLMPEGAWSMNGWVKAQPDIYYFSWSTRISYETEKGEIKPHPRMTLFLYPPFQILSRYNQYRSTLIGFDKKWFHNDGLANTYGMKGPQLNSEDLIQEWNGSGIPPKGIWNHCGELYPMDHEQIIGMSPLLTNPENFPGLIPWYTAWAEQLSRLP
ncbi:MAG: hypothetical protein PQJ60_06490, partial [Spirochaetales bacterium]|nr:hypothetical protein [Spirochaetales bacterium]